LESYFIMNDGESGLDRMKNRYQKMVESPNTTLWEGWDIGSAKYGGGTYNHGWTGGPLTLMHEYIAGVKVNKTEAIILPQPADLRYFSSKSNTLFGLINESYKIDNQKVTLNISVPKGIVGKMGLPIIKGKKYRKIMVNGISKKPIAETENHIIFKISDQSTNILGEF
jgi:alpha-L-rhamnosidase